MTVVADSCPLIFIAAVSQFALLRLYFSSILIPSAVYQEVVDVGGERPGAEETQKALTAGWISIAEPTEEPRVATRPGNGWGSSCSIWLGARNRVLTSQLAQRVERGAR